LAGTQFDRKVWIVLKSAPAYAFGMTNTSSIMEDGLSETIATDKNMRAFSSSDSNQWEAVLRRDAARDGEFFFAVSTTGVYCRPSCPSRRPRRENVSFFRRPEDAESAGFRACLRCRPKSVVGNPQTAMVKRVCRYLEQHLDEPVTLTKLGEVFGQSPFHLQRTFKKTLGITPKAYADSCRMSSLKRNLQAGKNVTSALYEAGYSSSSRLYERTASQLGMTPDKYRRGAIAANIRYTCTGSPLGRMLVAATDKGICAIQFADSDEELTEGLKREFPFANRKQDDAALRSWTVQLLSQMSGQKVSSALPLDIQATAFQKRVWTHLQSLPFGTTQSYGEVAKAIGRPTAARAVARACASNRIAVAIPCHRVVREDGNMGGYRWGMERKRKLLRLEQEGTKRRATVVQ